MKRQRVFRLLLPLGLGLAGVMLLIRISLPQPFFADNRDIPIILLGLSLAIFASAHWIIGELLERLRLHTMERAREEALSEHRRFLKRLDHELKNPLTALRAGLGSLSITLSDEKQRDLVQTLASEAQRLSRIVNDLRKLAELEALPLDVQMIDVHAFLADVVEFSQERFPTVDRRFTAHLPRPGDRLPPLIGDQDLLLLAIHNVLDNAFKYTRPGDEIRLSAFVEADTLTIEVLDTGIGIAQGEAPLVWEELYRGAGVQGIPGSGIGLALVKAIIERHYGTVSLQSRTGSGTRVTLQLPLADVS